MGLHDILKEIIPHQPNPKKCLNKKTLMMLMKPRAEVARELLEQYDKAVEHLAECRACAYAAKDLQLNDPDYQMKLFQKAVKEARFRKMLESVDLKITFIANKETGKQEVHVSYISPPHFMAYEHEERHREILLNLLLEEGVISAEDKENVIITRTRLQAPSKADKRSSSRVKRSHHKPPKK